MLNLIDENRMSYHLTVCLKNLFINYIFNKIVKGVVGVLQ